MLYNDSVYGKVNIREKVIIDLMNSRAMQRLKHVSQGGPLIFLPSDHAWNKSKTTRFEHSMGVYILLNKFDASLEEQIAGLLHDISHTVFSHSLDFLFNLNIEHDYHENFKEEIILNSEIPSILKKNGIDIKKILNEKKFGLLERKLPDLCADRIDYFFKDFKLYTVSEKEFKIMFDALDVFNNEIIFKDKNAARIFAEKYIQANKLFWCNAFQATIFKLVSDVVKLGLNENILTKNDLFSTDEIVYNKLKNSGDNEIIDKIKSISEIKIIEDEHDYDLHLKTKVRCTDPKIKINEKIIKLSKIDKSYEKIMNDFIQRASKGFFIKIIKS
jgi:hypothetical protein